MNLTIIQTNDYRPLAPIVFGKKIIFDVFPRWEAWASRKVVIITFNNMKVAHMRWNQVSEVLNLLKDDILKLDLDSFLVMFKTYQLVSLKTEYTVEFTIILSRIKEFFDNKFEGREIY